MLHPFESIINSIIIVLNHHIFIYLSKSETHIFLYFGVAKIEAQEHEERDWNLEVVVETFKYTKRGLIILW